MPIYEYHCSTCPSRVEVFVRTSTTTPHCPDCGGLLTDKLFSVPHVLRSETRRPSGQTCCGQEERGDRPSCSGGASCHHD